MICVCPADCTDFSVGGNGTLAPLSAEVTETLNGGFPVLKPGVNAVSWSGTATRGMVGPNYRYP